MNAGTLVPVLAVLVLGSSCGPYRAGTDPDAMSETAHRERAESLRRQAHGRQRRHDPSEVRRSETTHGGYGGLLGGGTAGATHPSPPGQVMDPGARNVRAAQRLRELAREHEAAADELAAFEARECADVGPDDRAGCPLLGSVGAVTAIEGGVMVELEEDADREAVLERARCHVAFGRRRGRAGMPSCPLYVEGARVELEGDHLLITTDVSAAVDELRQRAAAHGGAGT